MAKRFSGPIHLRLVGDKLAASRLVGRARTLLGVLLDVITPHGAISGSREYQFANGERIRVLAAGAIKVIEIFSPVLAERLQQVLFRGFVPTVSYDDPTPVSIGTYPQVVLTPDKDGDDWAAHFYASEFFYSQSSAKRKLTYGQDVLNGLKHAGQIDWRSKEGVHISWHGPANRYWWSPAQAYFLSQNSESAVYFGRKVYCAGKVLLDVDAYDSANATSLAGFVMGAGLLRLGRGSYYLFVIVRLSFLGDNEVAHRVVRYSCSIDSANENDLCKLRVDNGTAQLLYSFNSQFSKSPWFFNEDCTIAVHMSDDRTYEDPTYYEDWYANYQFAGSAAGRRPPPASNRIVTLDLRQLTPLSEQTVSVPVADFDDPESAPYIPERFPVAVDFRGNTLVTAYLRFVQTDTSTIPYYIDAYLDVDDASYHLGRTVADANSLAGPDRIYYNPQVFFRQIRYADLRNNFVVAFAEYTAHAEPSEVDLNYVYGAVNRYEELWSAGSLTWRQLVLQRPETTGAAGGELYTHAMYIPQYCNLDGAPSENITFATMAPRAFMNAGWNTAAFYASIAGSGGVSYRQFLTTGFLYDACPIDFGLSLRFTTYSITQTVEDEDGSRWFMAAGKLDGKTFVSLPEGGTNGFPPSFLTGGNLVPLTGTRSVDDARFYPMFILDKLPE